MDQGEISINQLTVSSYILFLGVLKWENATKLQLSDPAIGKNTKKS